MESFFPPMPQTALQMKAGTVAYQNIQDNWCFYIKPLYTLTCSQKPFFLPGKKMLLQIFTAFSCVRWTFLQTEKGNFMNRPFKTR